MVSLLGENAITTAAASDLWLLWSVPLLLDHPSQQIRSYSCSNSTCTQTGFRAYFPIVLDKLQVSLAASSCQCQDSRQRESLAFPEGGLRGEGALPYPVNHSVPSRQLLVLLKSMAGQTFTTDAEPLPGVSWPRGAGSEHLRHEVGCTYGSHCLCLLLSWNTKCFPVLNNL